MTQRVAQEDLLEILQAFEASGFARLELAIGTVRVAANRAASATPAPSVDSLSDTVQVVAPLLGRFQAGSPPLMQPGATVDADTIVGFIRVRQNQTPVKAGLCGTVLEVLVQDGQLVEFAQPLMSVCTSSDPPGIDTAGSSH